jgi:hypothetical protein
MISILDDLAKYFLRLWSILGNPLQVFVNEKLPPLPQAAQDHPLTCLANNVQTFLSLAVKCDMFKYVKRRAPRAGLATPLDNVVPRTLGAGDRPPTTGRKFSWTGFGRSMKKWKSESREHQVGWPLLLDAIQLRSTAASASTVAVLLENGADPNHNIEGSGVPEGYGQTVWIHALALILRVLLIGLEIPMQRLAVKKLPASCWQMVLAPTKRLSDWQQSHFSARYGYSKAGLQTWRLPRRNKHY